ncbi:MAG: hypothetical protein ACYCQH_09345 [Acidithiobacillus ferrooxidans]
MDHIIAGSGWPVVGIGSVPVSDVAHGPHTELRPPLAATMNG